MTDKDPPTLDDEEAAEKLEPLTKQEVIQTLKESGVNVDEYNLVVKWESEGKIKKPRRDGRIWVSKTEFEALKREHEALSQLTEAKRIISIAEEALRKSTAWGDAMILRVRNAGIPEWNPLNTRYHDEAKQALEELKRFRS